MMKIVRKIVNVTITLFTTLLFIVTLLVLFESIRANKNGKLPNVFGYTYSVVSSPSMEPIYYRGDIIFTKNIPFEEITINDNIVFFSPMYNKYIVHQVIKINEDGSLQTKGVNNQLPDDENVYKENYVGRVILKIPKIGNLALEKRNTLFIVVIFVITVIIVIEIKNIIKETLENRKDELEKDLKEKYGKVYDEQNK